MNRPIVPSLFVRTDCAGKVQTLVDDDDSPVIVCYGKVCLKCIRMCKVY